MASVPGAMEEASPVTISDEEGVRSIVLNRPATANAADPELMRALCKALDAATGDPSIVAIVLRGKGQHFLAGGDFDWLAAIAAGDESDAAGEIYRWFQGATRRLMACPKPVVAAVSGAAMTVGCELALACDVRILDRRAFFQQSWLDLGLIGPLGSAKLLPHLIGFAKAKEMMLECRKIDAEEALAIGLANEIVDGDELVARAHARAKAMAARPAAAFARMKALLHDALSQPLEEVWQGGVAVQGKLLQGEGFRNAVAARLVDRARAR